MTQTTALILTLVVKPGSPTVAMPGYDVQVLDEEGQQVEKAGTIGA